MIKAIIFDCFGVLTRDAWREFCSTLPNGEILATAKALNRQYDSGQLPLHEFVKRINEISGLKLQLDEDTIATPDPEKNNLLLKYIQELKAKYKIGLISNVGTNWIRDYFLNHEEQAMFDDMILSFEVGVTKPDPAIYEMAAERLGVQPREAIFIDDIDRYCDAAEAVGMKSIVYSDFNQFKSELEKILAADSDR